MEIIDFVPRPDQFVYTFGGAAPAATIEPGTALRLWSEDALNNAITTRSDVPSSKLDPHRLNPQTGSLYVNGAEPGVAVAVHTVAPPPARRWGASATIHLVGGLTATHRTSLLHGALPEAAWIYDLVAAAQTVGFTSPSGDFDHALPVHPMLSTDGVAPAGGEVHSSLT